LEFISINPELVNSPKLWGKPRATGEKYIFRKKKGEGDLFFFFGILDAQKIQH
jgi:hypothetical protein